MRVATHEERDKLLRVDETLVDRLRSMQAAGESIDSMISFMGLTGIPKPGATLALRLAGIMTLGESKLAVHFSQAYAYRREADEAFEESVMRDLELPAGIEAAA